MALLLSVKFAFMTGQALGGVIPLPEGIRDFQTLVFELDRLLVNSGTNEPLILVGASLGGAIVQMYAQQFPAKVAGLLLLDARARRA
jgi:pimeloyl-ACP methyl ester carboxylesterase